MMMKIKRLGAGLIGRLLRLGRSSIALVTATQSSSLLPVRGVSILNVFLGLANAIVAMQQD